MMDRKLKKFIKKFEPVEDVSKPAKPMKVDDLKCDACGLVEDYKEFKVRGLTTFCPSCKSDEISCFYGLPYNRPEDKRRRRR